MLAFGTVGTTHREEQAIGPAVEVLKSTGAVLTDEHRHRLEVFRMFTQWVIVCLEVCDTRISSSSKLACRTSYTARRTSSVLPLSKSGSGGIRRWSSAWPAEEFAKIKVFRGHCPFAFQRPAYTETTSANGPA